MADPDPMTCDPGTRVYDPDPGTVIPDPIHLVTTLALCFKYTRFFIRSVRKCQLKSICFTLLHFFDNYHILMKGLPA